MLARGTLAMAYSHRPASPGSAKWCRGQRLFLARVPAAGRIYSMSLPSDPDFLHIPLGRFAVVPLGMLGSDISPVAFRLWCVLASFQNDEHQAWPSNGAILDLMPPDTTTRSLRRAKGELISLGLLTVEVRYSSTNSELSSLYTLFHPTRKTDEMVRHADEMVRGRGTVPSGGGGPVGPPVVTDQEEQTKKLTTLSGSRQTACGIIDWLNQKTGKNFRHKDANLDLIRARLKDGIEDWQLRAIVSRKVREWQGMPQAKFLRPETLFNRTKCEQYLGELPPAEAKDG